jgi:TolB-like protein
LKGRWIVRATLFWLTLLRVGVSSPAEAQNQPVVVAILPFQDLGSYGQDKEVSRALQLGIPATIAGELANHPELRLADPARVDRAFRSGLDATTRVDAATAARLGKEAGARYAITGSFADFYGKIRLDARVVDSESGEILKIVSNDPSQSDRSQLYRIIQSVGHKVLAACNPGASAPSASANETRSIPTDALTEYSLGLLSERSGDRSRAVQHYQKALGTFSDYPDAKAALARVQSP